MPYNSSGVFSLVPGYLATAGEEIRSSQHNPPLEDIASALSQVVLRSGVAPMGGNLNINGYRIINVASGVDNSDGANIGDITSKLSTININTTGSLTGGGSINQTRQISLVNDVANPGPNMSYGTNPGGVKGFYSIFSMLGFTPVEQGGGVGMFANKIRIGWDSSRLRAQVDNTQLGEIWTDAASPRDFGTIGYHRLPSGMIINWGQAAGDQIVIFASAFPTGLFFHGAMSYAAPSGASDMHSITVSSVSVGGMSIISRQNIGGTISMSPANYKWFAVGH